MVYWVLWVMMLSLLLYSKIKKRIDLIKPCALILLVRNILPMLDFDGRRFKNDSVTLNFYIISQIMLVIFIQIGINTVSSLKQSAIMTCISVPGALLGALFMCGKE
jgi:uncharacterized Tic20 family protein